jgi:formate dehydrogenase major subunit
MEVAMDSPVMQFSPQPDAGTPLVSGADEVTVTIDGLPVSVGAGTSIMRAAYDAGIQVPKLCASDQLDSYGSCRVCLVQIEGRRGLPASCTTLVEPGMVIHTQGEQLARVRRNVVELYVADHPLDCETCAADGDCELQSVAADVGVLDSRYPRPDEAASAAPTDASNPYFEFDPNLCIQCSRCVRACEDIQGTYALTMEGRGPETRVVAGTDQPFFESDCVSCGACVAACPTGSLLEGSVIAQGTPAQVVDTTCAYCGVGCSFRAEVRDEQVIRMVPSKSGGANAGHACVKGRFAWGYANHAERVLRPLIRETSSDDWTEVDWDAAIDFAARKFTDIRARYGAQSIGGISSSRCTNEEVFVVQKMVRAAFGNNNIDTCARVCHSPTGYGLKQTFGTSAGTQDFASVEQADVVLLIGANPTDAHPVFASRMKKRLRTGAELIVVDPRRIDLVRTPHIEASHHLAVVPGTNVALMNALAHVVVSEGLCDEDFVRQRCDTSAYQAWLGFIADSCHAPERTEQVTGVPASDVRAAARLYARAPNAAIYYGLGVTEHSQGSTMVMCMANLAMATGNIGRDGVGVNPLRGQNNVQGACDMGSFPHELPGYRHISDAAARSMFESDWQVRLDPEPGLRIPNMFSEAGSGAFKGMFIQGEDVAQSDPDTQHVQHALGSLECLIVQDLFLNETAQFAHVFLPGTSFLEKDGTFTNAERRINRVRPVTEPRTGLSEWHGVPDGVCIRQRDNG